ncbi:MAG: biotin/lipoyl-binding protein [Anaerolineae bacterium]|jgi:biotin carboxyl carrier protein|nr:MAG: biotin/lipoyl-binding protein [Anaerolineae bacterium]
MEFRYEHNDVEYVVQLEPQPDGTYLARVGDNTYQVQVQRSLPGQMNLVVNGQRFHAYTASQQSDKTGVKHHHVALVDTQAQHYEFTTAQSAAVRRRGTSAEGGSLKAQMPGQVIQVMIAEGDAVEKGQPLLILEAMKMEIRVTAPMTGIVVKLLVKQGDTVERGQQLVEVAENI